MYSLESNNKTDSIRWLYINFSYEKLCIWYELFSMRKIIDMNLIILTIWYIAFYTLYVPDNSRQSDINRFLHDYSVHLSYMQFALLITLHIFTKLNRYNLYDLFHIICSILCIRIMFHIIWTICVNHMLWTNVFA